MGLFFIFLFVILLAVPGFYLITRAIFPQRSKRTARLTAYLLTVLLVIIMAVGLLAKL